MPEHVIVETTEPDALVEGQDFEVSTDNDLTGVAKQTKQEQRQPEGTDAAGDDDDPEAQDDTVEAKDDATDEGDAVEDAGQPGDDESGRREAEPRKKRRLERRAERLRKRARKAERERDELRGRITALEGRLNSDQQTDSDGTPDRDNFDSYDDWVQAVAEHQAKRVVAQLNGKRKDREPEATSDDEYDPTDDPRWDDYRDEYGDDFDRIALNPRLPVTQAMAEAMGDTDVEGDILMYLGNNRRLARRISRMKPAEADEAIADIADQIEDGEIDPVETRYRPQRDRRRKGKSHRGALKPEKPVRATNDRGNVSDAQAYDEMPMDDYAKTRTRQELKRRGL